MAEEKIVIACDFGTTYSGIAAAYSKTPDNVEIIRTWPGGNGVSSDKVPTQFTYKLDQGNPGDSVTSDQLIDLLRPYGSRVDSTIKDIRWGNEVLPFEQRISCIKLFIDRGQKLPNFVSPNEIYNQLRQHDRDVEAAIADFLHKIREHALDTLRKRWGEVFLRSTKIEYVLTVPAIWSDGGKETMKQVAKRAGFAGELKMISEPEAAAVHTLNAIQPNHLRVGDNMVVCDAGGGTVDLISYEITKTSPLQVVESTVGTGGLCGGSFINRRFELMCENRIGKQKFDIIKDTKPKTWRIALDAFEDRVKRWFGSVNMTEFEVPFPGLPDDESAGIEDGCLILKAGQVKELFDPVVEDVVALVDGQVKSLRSAGKKVSAILCVGGFGGSAYLFKRMKDHFQTDLPPPYSPHGVRGFANNFFGGGSASAATQAIEVMQPQDAWSAVVRGACLRGLEDTIVKMRKARYNYGVTSSNPFEQSLHPMSSRYWDDYDECYYARGAMTWYVTKGDDVSEEREINFDFSRVWDEKPRHGPIVSDDLLFCNHNVPPIMRSANGIAKLCTLTTDLSTVPRSYWIPKRVASGKTRWGLNYNMVMRIDSANIEFALKIKDITYGSVAASFAH